jgi:hypothetical protein
MTRAIIRAAAVVDGQGQRTTVAEGSCTPDLGVSFASRTRSVTIVGCRMIPELRTSASTGLSRGRSGGSSRRTMTVTLQVF